MKNIINIMFIIVIFFTLGHADGTNYKLCESDFDRNGLNDIAILKENNENSDLVVLLNNEKSYKKYVLYKGNVKNLLISCQYVNSVNAILKDTGDRVYQKLYIDSYIIKVIQPESSMSIYYWKKNKFIEAWISD